MKRRALELKGKIFTERVYAFPDDRVAYPLKMDTDLICAAGDRLHFDHRKAAAPLRDLISCLRGFISILVPIIYWGFYNIKVFLNYALHECRVPFLNRPRLERVHHELLDLLTFGI